MNFNEHGDEPLIPFTPATDGRTLDFALTDRPKFETAESASDNARTIADTLFDVYTRAKSPVDPDMDDGDARAEATYMSHALTGSDDVYGRIWNGGRPFANGREFLRKMRDFVNRDPDERHSRRWREYMAKDAAGRLAEAMEARSALDRIRRGVGDAAAAVRDAYVENGVPTANPAFYGPAAYATPPDGAKEENDARRERDRKEYERQVLREYELGLARENAWSDLASILALPDSELSAGAKECVRAVMASEDVRLPETLWAKFNALPDAEKHVVCRTRRVMKADPDGDAVNFLRDLAAGALNVGTSIATAPWRFGNKIGQMAFMSDYGVDVNELSRRRQMLWEATGDFFAGGAGGGHLPQMQLEQTCNRHGFVAEALIGAVSTLPYMGAAALPGIGTPLVAIEAMNEMDDHVALEGGDVSDPAYICASAVLGGLYAYTERLQLEGLLGGVGDLEVRTALLKGLWKGALSKDVVRSTLAGTVAESVQEGLQNGIMEVNEALALDGDATRAFAEGFTSDFIGSLGTMLVVEAGGHVVGHAKRSGYLGGGNSMFASAGREAGREARSMDVVRLADSMAALQDMVNPEARATSEHMREIHDFYKAWKDGGAQALRRRFGLSEGGASEVDGFFKAQREAEGAATAADESVPRTLGDGGGKTLRAAYGDFLSGRSDAAALRSSLTALGFTEKGADDYVLFARLEKDVASRGRSVGRLLAGRYDRSRATGEEKAKSLARVAGAMEDLDPLRRIWANGRGVYLTDKSGKTVADPGARALEAHGFTKDAAERLSRVFHYERAAARSRVALDGVKALYEARMRGRVDAAAAMRDRFGGRMVRLRNGVDGKGGATFGDYLAFKAKDGSTKLVQIVEDDIAAPDFSDPSPALGRSVADVLNANGWADAHEGRAFDPQTDWADRSPEERGKIWEKYNLGQEGFYTPVPHVTMAVPGGAAVDSAQAAELVGRVAVAGRSAGPLRDADGGLTGLQRIVDTSAVFHEVFHAFSDFAKQTGIFDGEDLKNLRERYGEPSVAGESYDEETGAEAFRAYLSRRMEGAASEEDETGPWRKLAAFVFNLKKQGEEKAAREAARRTAEERFYDQIVADAMQRVGSLAEEEEEKPAPPASAAPAAPADSAPPAPAAPAAPKTWSAFTPTGNVRVSGHWRVFDLSELVHSNNPLYAQYMRAQLRDRRDNKAEEDTRNEIVNNFQAERLLEAPDTANGAPIVFMAPDEAGTVRPFVLSGNGRVLVLNDLNERHLFDRYRDTVKRWAAANGVRVPDGGTPVLVRVIDDYGGETRDRIADLSNTNSIQQYNEEEQARADAEVVRANNLARLYVANQDGTPDMSGANDEFFAEFVRGVGDSSLYASDRALTQKAVQRATRALMAIAAGQGSRGRDVVKKLVERTDTLGVNRQKNAVVMMAAPVAALEGKPEYAIGPDVSRAVADFMDYVERKARGVVGTIGDVLAEGDMFDPRSEIADEILRLLASNRAAATIAEYVKEYCRAAGQEDPAGNLFGAARTRTEIWHAAAKLVDERAAAADGQAGARHSVAADPQTAAARREYDEVVVRYTNPDGTRRAGWMKAPNGRPTNLSERQWVQVRTPSFKKWFGDWEKSGRLTKLRAAAPISLDWDGKYDLNQKSAREWMLANIRDTYENRDTEDRIRVSRDGVKKVTSHGMYDETHLKSMSIVPQLIQDSIFIDELDATSEDKKYDKYRYYVAGVKIDGEAYTAKVVVGIKSGEAYYDHNLTKIEKGNLIDALNKVDNPVASEISLDAAHDTKLLKILQLPPSVSKVVDGNGEPLVVYHGSRWNPLEEPNGGATFRHDKVRNASEGIGFYFTPSRELAESYGGNVAECFLEMRRPVYAYDRPALLEMDEIYDIYGNEEDPVEAAKLEADATKRKLRSGMERVLSLMRKKGWRFYDEIEGDLVGSLEAKTYEGLLDYALDAESFVKGDDFDTEAFRDDFRAAQAEVFGVDGYYSPNYAGGAGAYVAFRRSQIKSATDNAGAFSQDNPDVRFSVRVNPNLRDEVEAALNTDRAKGEVLKGGRRIVLCDAPGIFSEIGVPAGAVYTKAYTLRKIAREHSLTAGQIASAPELLERPAAVFDDNGEGFVFLTDATAPDEDGKIAPVMFYIRPDGSGNYVASAYARKEAAESKYVNLVNARKVLYVDKKKVAHLPLRGEARSSLITFSVGDGVKTAEEYSAWASRPKSIPQSGAERGTRFSIVLGERGAARLERNAETLANLKFAKQLLGKSDWNALSVYEKRMIKMATGWEVGADGMWRLERRTPKLKDGWIGRVREGTLLCEIFEDDADVFAAHPQMRTLSVFHRDLHGAAGASSRYAIVIDTRDAESQPDEVLDTLLHEVQHHVQRLEGFAQGGNPSQFRQRRPEDPTLRRIFDDVAKKARRESFLLGSEWRVAYALKRIGDGREVRDGIDESERGTVSRLLEAHLVESGESSVKALAARLARAYDMQSPMGQYRRLAGEVEARNAARRSMRDMERLLEETEDESRDAQIVRDAVGTALEKVRDAESASRFSVRVNPNLREDVEAALARRSDDAGVRQMKRHAEIVFSEDLPMLEFLGIPSRRVVSDATRIRKLAAKHHLDGAQIADLPERCDSPAAVMRDGVDGYVVLTDMLAETDDGERKPVRVFLRPKTWRSGEVVFLATAMAENAADERAYYEPLVKSGLLYADQGKIAGLMLGEETESILRTQASGDGVKTAEEYSAWTSRPESIPQSGAERGTRFSIGKLYTGGAADYEKPSLHFVGTGEGSQVYGWGLYASDRRGVAEQYAKATKGSAKAEVLYKGKQVDENSASDLISMASLMKYAAEHPEYGDFEAYMGRHIAMLEGKGRLYKPVAEDEKRLLKMYRADPGAWKVEKPKENVYEQTFFTDRAPGDESRLLKWYEPVGEAQRELILEGLKDLGGEKRRAAVEFVNRERERDLERDGLTWKDVEGEDAAPEYYPDDVLHDYLERYIDLSSTGGEVYGQLWDALGSPRAASEFLAGAGVDGVKYPVDSYGGKGVKDGEEAGWNYVSFRDDNISVDHKWTDGEMRFSVRIAPDYEERLTFGRVDERTAKATVDTWRKSRTEFVNRRNSRVAEVKSDWSKVFSSKAKGQSDSYEAHYAAANNLKTLFENGVKYHEEKPRNGSADIAAYAKYACPFTVGGTPYLAKITVKEYPAVGGAKDGVYSVEAISAEKIGVGGNNAAISSIRGQSLDSDAINALGEMLQTSESIPQSGAERGTRFSITPAEDAAYLDAVKRGDMEAAQRMVDGAAAKAGYATPHYFDAHSAPSPAYVDGGRENFRNLDELRRVLEEDGGDVNLFAIANGISPVPEDYLTPRGLRLYGQAAYGKAAVESLEALSRAAGEIKRQMDEYGEVRDMPKVTVFRAVPSEVREGRLQSDGQWVSPSRTYAVMHGERRFGENAYRVIEQSVGADELWFDGNAITEWGFDDGRPSVYRNTENNRKLMEPVTYDDAGNVIPLSQRFDPATPDVRFSVRVNPNLREDVARLTNTDRTKGAVSRRSEVIEFSDTPSVLRLVGMPNARIISRADILRKVKTEHNLSDDAISSLPDAYSAPAAVFRDGRNYVVLTDMMAETKSGAMKPVMVYLRSAETAQKRNFIASAYAREPSKESAYADWAKKGNLLYLDKEKAARLNLEEETGSQLRPQGRSGLVKTPEDLSSSVSSESIPQSGAERTAESVARNSIRAALADGGAGEAERALANYVAYFKLSHGGMPSRKTIARMGLAMGMKTVMPDRIEKSGRDMADRVRGTLIEQAARNGDVASALALMRRENAVDQALDDLVAGGAAAGGAFTHKGVGRVNDIINRRVETMMKSFTAASLADMEGETGLDIASEILANDPDAFDPKPQKPDAGPAAPADGDEEGGGADDDAEDAGERPLSDREKWERERRRKEAEKKVRKFIEEAKKRAEERRLEDEERRKRAEERRAQGLAPEEGGEGGAADFAPVAAELEAAKEDAPKGTVLADFRSPSEFAAFLRVWAADRFARQHGHTSLAKAQQDRLFAEFYRICARKELGDLADKLLAPKGARAFVNRRLQDLEKGVRPDTVERISAAVFAFINKAAIRETRDSLVKKFKKDLRRRYLKGARFDQMKQDSDRKVTGWVEESVRYICRVCDLSRRSLNGNPSAYEKERAKLLERINRREEVYDDAGRKIADAATADMETVHAMAKLALLDKYGAMKSLMPGRILDLQDEAFRYFEDEARKLEDRWRETRDRQESIRIALAAAIVAPKGQRYQEKGWLNGRLFDALNGLIRLRLVHLTRFAPDEARRRAESAINDVLVMLGDGETAYARALQEDRAAFFAGLAQTFQKPGGGADNAAIKKYLEHMDEAIPEDLSRRLSKQGYVGTMTYGQMLQLLVSLEQGSFRNAVKANGRDGQAALIRGYRTVDGNGNAVNVFTREDGRFVDWLRAFYERKRGAISQVTMRMVGHEVLSPDPLYCPVRRSMDDRARGLHADPTPRWDPISKAFSRRVENLRDFDESRSIVGMFFESSEESAKLVAWAERGTIIRNVFTHVGVQNAIRRAFGAGELGNILKQLEATFNGGKSRSTTPGEIAAADKAMNFITYSYLAFNPLSALKQTTGFTVWANALPNGFRDLWRHMTHVDKDVVKHIMESEQYKVRYGDEVGGGQDLATKGLYENPSTNPLARAVSGAGMKMLKWGDMAPGVWIAQGLYKDLLDRHMAGGMDYDAADRRAMTETFNLLEETQQSGRTYNTNRMAIEHGRIARLLTQFATSPLQQLQFETQAWREWRDMVRYEMGEKKIAAARQRFWRAALINHILLPAALELVVSAYKLAMGEKPPWEKEGAHWDFLTEILLGQFSSVFFLGALTQTTLTALFKREQSSRGILPVEGAIGTVSSAAFLMHDLVAMDADNVRKDLERAIKSTAPTRIPYNVARRVLGDSDVDRKRKKEKRK